MRIEKLFPSHTQYTHHMIVAPHHDDEVIGCFELMSTGTNWSVVHCADDEKRRTESIDVAKGLGCFKGYPQYKQHVALATLAERLMTFIGENPYASDRYTNGGRDTQLIVWFPDPSFEMHPDHIFVGEVGRMLAREYADKEHYTVLFGFYSVNMKSPYVHVLSQEAQEKKRKACEHFVSQSEYFAQNQHSWIFEGRYLV